MVISKLCVWSHHSMNPQIDKVVRVTTVVATAVASYFLLTADEPNALDPIRRRIFSAQDSVKEFIFPSKKPPAPTSDNEK